MSTVRGLAELGVDAVVAVEVLAVVALVGAVFRRGRSPRWRSWPAALELEAAA